MTHYHDIPTRDEALREVAKNFARDMKVLFGNDVARRKNLKRARKEVRQLFDRLMKDQGQ